MNYPKGIDRLYCISCAVMLLTGCGSAGPFDYVRASGKITYTDGSPIPGSYKVFFYSESPPVGNAHPRPGIADVDAQGNFACVTSHTYADGLTPGKHKVSLSIGGMDASGRPKVPAEYTDPATTLLEVDTKDLPFDIKIPKPGETQSPSKSK
jgi:hypothetical protein